MSRKIVSFDDIVSRSLVVRVQQANRAINIFADDRAVPVSEVVDDPVARDEVLTALGVDLSEVVALTDASVYPTPASNALKGIGRIGVVPFLELVSDRLEEKKYGSNLRIKVGGKACDHIFIPTAHPSDPSDCPSYGRGHLSVDVLHEYFETDADLRACKPNRTVFHHWDIEICKYEVHRRYDLIDEYKENDDHFPNNPFPTLDGVAFPTPALDPDDPRSIWCRCLDHKLYAKGKDVKVERVYRQICNHPSSADDEDFHLLDPEDPQYADYYAETDDACVDIMFAGYPPLAGLPKQREYCLGRCGHPDIVNTGM